MKIILFDGVCNLCNSSVDFIIRHDPKGVFKFAALQTLIGQDLITKFKIAQDAFTPDSIVLIDGDKWFDKSTAALKIARELSGVWSLLSIFLLLPRFLRDQFYGLVARNRYRIFGKRDTCRIPEPAITQRFLS